MPIRTCMYFYEQWLGITLKEQLIDLHYGTIVYQCQSSDCHVSCPTWNSLRTRVSVRMFNCLLINVRFIRTVVLTSCMYSPTPDPILYNNCQFQELRSLSYSYDLILKCVHTVAVLQCAFGIINIYLYKLPTESLFCHFMN